MYQLLSTFSESQFDTIFYTDSCHQFHEIFFSSFRNYKYFSKICTFSWVGLFCDQFSFIVPIFNHLHMVTAQWNFFQSLFSLILSDFYQICFEISNIFRKTYTSQKKLLHLYSFIVPSLEYFLVVLAQLNVVHSFLLSMSRNLNLFLNYKYFSRNMPVFALRLLITVLISWVSQA